MDKNLLPRGAKYEKWEHIFHKRVLHTHQDEQYLFGLVRAHQGASVVTPQYKIVFPDMNTIICENNVQNASGGQSTQIKYLSKSTDTYNKILLQ